MSVRVHPSAIGQPIIRERHTGFPVIPGSAVKGVLRDYAAEQNISDIKKLFGNETIDDTAFAGAIPRRLPDSSSTGPLKPGKNVRPNLYVFS